MGVPEWERIHELVLEYLRSSWLMFDVYHEDGWSGDPLYHNWGELKAVDSNTEHFTGENITKGEDSIVSIDV